MVKLYEFTNNPHGSDYQFYLTAEYKDPAKLIAPGYLVEVAGEEYYALYTIFDNSNYTLFQKINNLKIDSNKRIYIDTYKYDEKDKKMILVHKNKLIKKEYHHKLMNNLLEKMAKHFAPELYI
jgi:hypothetical protein